MVGLVCGGVTSCLSAFSLWVGPIVVAVVRVSHFSRLHIVLGEVVVVAVGPRSYFSPSNSCQGLLLLVWCVVRIPPSLITLGLLLLAWYVGRLPSPPYHRGVVVVAVP